MRKYEELQRKLREIFQIDRPELDFGIYRILNARAAEISDYLDNRLKAKVQASLAVSGNASVDGLRLELREKEAQYRSDGIDPDSVPKIVELRQKIAEYGTGAIEHENAVFTHLLTFFSRYYDKGDFISRRRYKGDTYAIPYSGEEVVLHWANKDQYYTKSGEYFSNYVFKLSDGRTVRFRLVTADMAKDNRKDNDKERRFVLVEPQTRTITDDEGAEHEETLVPVEEVNGELELYFDYKSMPKGTRQADLVAEAVRVILDHPVVANRWSELADRMATEKNPLRSLLEKCLTSYTEKNLADYFIHKDLGGFLRHELDFYIKNEVMNLDDVARADSFAAVEKNLRMIQTLRAIALDLITFLSQLEEFQKKLWLKKKFVVSAHYSITLDRIPESLYPAIAANEKQWEQWKELGMIVDSGKKADLFGQIEPGSVEYLREYRYLMVDTSLFDAGFRQALLQSVEDLDESTDGLLIQGDNFQALNLLQERYREQVKCVYIDPPYNTDAGPISYKNGYRSSSWATLMDGRIKEGRKLLCADGVLVATIDDYQYRELSFIIEENFGTENIAGTVVIRMNPSGRPLPQGFAQSHEYAIFAKATAQSAIASLPRSDKQNARYKHSDEEGKMYMWELFRKRGSNSEQKDRPSLYYPIYVADEKMRVPAMEYDNEKKVWLIRENPKEHEISVYPIDEKGVHRTWRGQPDALRRSPADYKYKIENGVVTIYYKFRPDSEGVLPLTNWIDAKYSATEHGTGYLKKLFSGYNVFSYPKSIYAVEDCLKVSGAVEEALVLDYFAGSGTTGHAVINLNRDDQGKRKYILVEQGNYFDTVLKPRIQKVVYSADWKDGKAVAPETGISHAFKVLRIESYEDTLNNLELRRTAGQDRQLSALPESVRDEYLMSYMLDIESRGSLLSVEQFRKPFDCCLKVAVDSAGAYEERPVDMVETFNYLIGLRVRKVDMHLSEGYVLVSGTLPSGEKTLIIWRDADRIGYEALDHLCETLGVKPGETEFEVVYINADHNIPSTFTATEAEGGVTRTLKIRPIEPEFLERMFSVESV